MLVIRLELWPRGDSTRARSLGVASITNVGGNRDVADYEVVLFKSPEYSKHAEKRPLPVMLTHPLTREIWKKGRVEAFPRLVLGPWDLLFRGLGALVAGRRNPNVEDGTFGVELSEDEEVGAIYETVDKMLRRESFIAVDKLLDGLEPKNLTPLVALAYASITFAARDKLTRRGAYMTRLREHFTSTFSRVRVEELLRGIDG